MTRGIVFDLDDTLYFERDYVRSGFIHVAALIGRSRAEARELAGWLEREFDEGVRGDAFDRLLASFPAIAERASIAALVDAYRTHRPAIELAPGVETVLGALRKQGLRLGVISDGAIESQVAKSEVLGLDRWFEPIVFTASLGPGASKPATTGFEAVAREWRLPPAELSYVADNPEKDFAGPRTLGWLTVRLRQADQLRHALEPPADAFRADLEIASPTELQRRLGLDS